jgi:hypothetical protein
MDAKDFVVVEIYQILCDFFVATSKKFPTGSKFLCDQTTILQTNQKTQKNREKKPNNVFE